VNVKKHILITGGSGLIGLSFIKRFQFKYDITVLVRTSTKKTLPKDVAIIYDLKSLKDLNHFDIVINLQGEPIVDKRWTVQQKKKIEQSRIEVTQTLSTLINHSTSPPEVFLSGSAVGFYGRQPNDKVITEHSTKCFQEFSHHLCAKWEKAALKAQKKTRVCLLRTGIVLSCQSGALAKMLPSFKFGLGATIADSKQIMSWIHIDDMVCAIDYIIEKDALSGPINLTAPTPVSNLEFSKTLSLALEKPCFLKLPRLAAQLILGEASDLLCYGQYVIPQKLSEHGFTFFFPTIREAIDNLVAEP